MAVRKTSTAATQKQAAQLAALTSGKPAPKAPAPAAPAQVGYPSLLEQIQAFQAAFPQLSAPEIAQMVANAQASAAQSTLTAKAPEKPAKPAPTPENMTIAQEGDELVIRVKLSKDTGKHTANGANLIIAQQSTGGPYKFSHKGRDMWLSCMVAEPESNAAELRKAYRASKASK
jgi:hypothetical protein